MSDIVQRLREASQGREEWRVADPETGAYCMAFSHAGSPNPEREAREWLADHIARFPNSPNATKVVTHAIAHFLDDQMQIEAADLIEAQAERIRVLREALEKVRNDKSFNGLKVERTQQFVIAALEATK